MAMREFDAFRQISTSARSLTLICLWLHTQWQGQCQWQISRLPIGPMLASLTRISKVLSRPSRNRKSSSISQTCLSQLWPKVSHSNQRRRKNGLKRVSWRGLLKSTKTIRVVRTDRSKLTKNWHSRSPSCEKTIISRRATTARLLKCVCKKLLVLTLSEI